MSLESKIATDLKEAMKAKDQAALRSIRSIKAALLLLKTDGSGDEINEDKEIKLLQKLVKQRQDSLDIFEKQGREDLAVTEREEIAVIQKYLPAQLSQDELRTAIQGIINGSGMSEAKDMGKVIGLANQSLSGKTEGKLIAAMVKELLN
jgi:uncharacterized protein